MEGTTHSGGAARLMEILGLTEDELCRTLDADPLTLLSGQLEHRPELPILLTMLNEALETIDTAMLQRWVRANGPAGIPVDALVGRDFTAFEDALAELGRRGFVLRGGGGERAGGSAAGGSAAGDSAGRQDGGGERAGEGSAGG
ncbi:MAG: hypothetical protein QOF83_1183 [Solirubrobacteraceae bacterium]|jgi:hypothetical protein|nr:hypothetical protein [Solirubrobacteraceae bacterium]